MFFPKFFRQLGLTALLAGAGAGTPAFAQDGWAGPYLAARTADSASDYSAEVQYGTRALVRDPGNAALMEELIMAQVALGQIDAAIPIAQKLESLDDTNNIAGLVLMANAMKREDWAGVDTLLDGGASVGDFLDNMIRAWSAIGAGHVNRAIELFDELAKDDANGDAARVQKALALAQVGDYEGAASIFGGEDGHVLSLNRAGIVAFAQVLSQLERDPDAVALIDRAYPDTQDDELVALRAQLAAGMPVPFTAVSGARAGLAQLFFEIGQSLLGDTDPGLVLIYVRLAQYLNPDNVGAILTAAKVLEKMGNDDLAATAYGQVPEADRGYAEAQLGRATAQRRMGKTDAALATLVALAKARPELPAAEAAIADTLRFEKRYDEASSHYDAAIALFKEDLPGQWNIYFARGITRERLGRWDDAVADFRKALELNPGQPSVMNYLGYSFVEKRENLDEALDMIKRAVAARPYDGYIRDSLGWVYYRLGKYDEAVDEMERAVELQPVEPVLNDHLGDAYWAVGRKREARFQWSRALSFVTKDTDLDELNPDRIRRKLEVGLDKVLEEEGGEPIHK